MTEFTEDFIVPEDQVNRSVPKKLANEHAFYTSELSSENPVEESGGIALDLEMSGTSPSYEEALQRWSEIQEITNREATINIISDPTIGIDEKTAVVRKFNNGELSSTNLKDQFVQETAARDVAPAGEEDIPISIQDIEAQELFLDSIETGLAIQDDLQAQKTAYAASLNPSTAAAIGGLISEVVSPLDQHGLRSAYTARDLGVTVDNEDILFFSNSISRFKIS